MMKEDEKHAQDFLSYKGFINIIYEPDGNCPPDFVIDNTIAVEVRRLNPFYINENITEPLETLLHGLISKIRNILKLYDNPSVSGSSAVFITFKRPFLIKKEFKKTIIEILNTQSKHINEEKEYLIQESVNLHFYPLNEKRKNLFVYAGFNDKNQGGDMERVLYESLKYSILEKTRKIDKVRYKYEHWWLILVNHIISDLERIDWRQIKQFPRVENEFDKVIVISRLLPNIVLEY